MEHMVRTFERYFVSIYLDYLVPDDVVISVVKKKIAACEKECRHWIIEGFPRTRVQALSMEQLGIIPDKMIALSCSQATSLDKIKKNLVEGKA